MTGRGGHGPSSTHVSWIARNVGRAPPACRRIASLLRLRVALTRVPRWPWPRGRTPRSAHRNHARTVSTGGLPARALDRWRAGRMRGAPCVGAGRTSSCDALSLAPHQLHTHVHVRAGRGESLCLQVPASALTSRASTEFAMGPAAACCRLILASCGNRHACSAVVGCVKSCGVRSPSPGP